MNARSTAPLAGLAGAATSVALAFAVCAPGIAPAWAALAPPNVVGQNYSDAVSALSGAGFTPVVGTAFGDRRQRGDCIVVGEVARSVPPPTSGNSSRTGQVLVSLNCEAGVASATEPGNSLASPEGRKAAQEAQAAAQAAQAAAQRAKSG